MTPLPLHLRFGGTGPLALALLASLARPADPAFRLVQEEPAWVCPPCGADCHDQAWPEPGACTVCGMERVPRSEVPQVAVVLFPGTDVLSFTGPATAFTVSRAGNVFTVADTVDPIRCQGYLEIVPRHSFRSAPRADVLIVPPIEPSELEDELVLEWLRGAVGAADRVLAVGSGVIAVARTGALQDADVAASFHPYWQQRATELAPDTRFHADLALLRAGKVLTARDATAALEGALRLVAELAGPEPARDAALRLGCPPPSAEVSPAAGGPR